ncbi:hypothetical protein L0128_03965, partial [candidate division KSB1 bacterium]|nr:hypothetical protein [candidate division KSB1 bacterium]
FNTQYVVIFLLLYPYIAIKANPNLRKGTLSTESSMWLYNQLFGVALLFYIGILKYCIEIFNYCI